MRLITQYFPCTPDVLRSCSRTGKGRSNTFAAVRKKLLRKSGVTSGTRVGRFICDEDWPPLGSKVTKRCGVKRKEDKSEMVLASDLTSVSAMASIRAKRWSAAAGFLSRRNDRKLIVSIETEVSAGSAN